ncbi:MAG: BMP family ABC transporter substrate-binding protein [Acidimicrobiia bacterium]|nr:BMP family ABC transporter substrate-binding protein [Acidimicrobiia bacterium]
MRSPNNPKATPRLFLLLVVISLIAAACGDDDDTATTAAATETTAAETTAASDEPCIRVGVLINLDRNDAGWNEAHYRGGEYLQAQIPCAEVTLLENMHETPETEAVMRDLADDGYDLIFATSFGLMEFTQRVAADYPDVIFEHASGYLSAENFSNYVGAQYEAAYLAGMAAGAVSEKGKIGYVGPFATPDVLRDLNGVVLGAREMNPDIEVQMVWVSSWFDPGLETQAAQTLIDDGADVLFYGTASPSVPTEAEAAGIHWVATNGLAERLAPDSFLAGINYEWGNYMVEATQAVIDGTWVSEPYWGTMADGFITLTCCGPDVPADVEAQIREREEQIKAGEFDPFAGPLVNQAGEVVVPEGESGSSFDHVFGVDYVLEGIEGTVPSG